MPTKRSAVKPKAHILVVEVLEAMPNPMFTEEQRAALRFLRFNRHVPCLECGKKRRVMWTMLCEFYAHTMGGSGIGFGLDSGKKHKPLTEVCGDHPLSPAWPEVGESAGQRVRKSAKRAPTR